MPVHALRARGMMGIIQDIATDGCLRDFTVIVCFRGHDRLSFDDARVVINSGYLAVFARVWSGSAELCHRGVSRGRTYLSQVIKAYRHRLELPTRGDGHVSKRSLSPIQTTTASINFTDLHGGSLHEESSSDDPRNSRNFSAIPTTPERRLEGLYW